MTTRFYYLGKIIREVTGDALTPVEIAAHIMNLAERDGISADDIYWEESEE